MRRLRALDLGIWKTEKAGRVFLRVATAEVLAIRIGGRSGPLARCRIAGRQAAFQEVWIVLIGVSALASTEGITRRPNAAPDAIASNCSPGFALRLMESKMLVVPDADSGDIHDAWLAEIPALTG